MGRENYEAIKVAASMYRLAMEEVKDEQCRDLSRKWFLVGQADALAELFQTLTNGEDIETFKGY